MSETTTKSRRGQQCAGIDVGKQWLDVALACGRVLERRNNDKAGHDELIGELAALGIVRVGLEATGGYEAALVQALRAQGFEVQVFQPQQVRAYAMFRLQRGPKATRSMPASSPSAPPSSMASGRLPMPDWRLLPSI